MFNFNVFIFILILSYATKCWSLYCKDENGNDVDWFILYKMPFLQSDEAPLNTGFSYASLSGPGVNSDNGDRPDEEFHWHLSKYLIKDRSSFLGQTLEPIYNQFKKSTSDISFVMYNDSPPPDSGKESSSYAHAKGVLAMDSTSGFWLIHSIPNFPEAPDLGLGYKYPASGRDNGQSALCISFPSTKESEDVVNQLLYMRPNVYNISVSGEAAKSTPQLVNLKNKKWPPGIDSNIATIDSVRGKEFVSFSRNSKASQVQGDLYADLIAPHLSSDLYVETWRRGAGTPLKSNCSSKYHVQNINYVELKFSDDSEVEKSSPWHYLEDHSKWAVGSSDDAPYVCVGDINRMASQFKRGGGAVCMKSDQVWKVLKDSVEEIEGCPRIVLDDTKPSSGSPRAPRRRIFATLMSSVIPMIFRLLGLNKEDESY